MADARSLGVGGKEGGINAPTVFNAALNVAQFWDGRAETLEQQVDGPITHPLEMASDWETIEQKLAARPEYVSAFTAALAEGPSREGVKQAIAAFERTLITVDSPFDLWLDGDSNALERQNNAPATSSSKPPVVSLVTRAKTPAATCTSVSACSATTSSSEGT